MNGFMNIEQALTALGAKRIIWIDDVFSTTQDDLATLLIQGIEITKLCNFEELHHIIELAEYDEASAHFQLSQILLDFDQPKKDAIKDRFFSEEVKLNHMPTHEASSEEVDAVCKVLSIPQDDRWSFEGFENRLKVVCETGDTEISYIVDLNNASGSPRQGLEVLKLLKQFNSKGTAFILTHETNAQGESQLEMALRAELDNEEPAYKEIPICVIAKERLSDQENENAINDALVTAIKRAGLRRSLHEVLRRIETDVTEAFTSAGSMLLEIPPEQLEQYVVERGRTEGVSELHIVERAITATVSQKLRDSFANNTSIQASTVRLRALRSITLDNMTPAIHQHLEQFRKLEIWEPDSLINSSYTPLACGDVFELDIQELSNGVAKKRFLLLGQPCDIAVRSNGTRDLETAFFIPLKVKAAPAESKLKEPLLPFKLDGEQLACDFRSATSVRLEVLDLASFRKDGRVRFDLNQPFPEHMLPGLEAIYNKWSPKLNLIIAPHSKLNQPEQLIHEEPLTISSLDNFKQVRTCKYKRNIVKKANQVVVLDLPFRLTWSLRRCGRVRMPYSASLLRDYTSVMSRQAFEVEYIK